MSGVRYSARDAHEGTDIMSETESAGPRPKPRPATPVTPATPGAAVPQSSISRLPDPPERTRTLAARDPLERIAADIASLRRMMIFFAVVVVIGVIAAVILALMVIGAVHSLQPREFPLG
jgi:hypothetical protein